MKKSIILGIVAICSFSMSAIAQTQVCHTVESCRELIQEAEADLALLLGDQAPDLTEIVARGVSQYEAIEICKQRGKRLPTAREFAMYAQSLGAVGISETQQDGYRLIRDSDINGNPVHFYFNYRGYQRPEGELGDKWFWSSSVLPDYSYDTYVFDSYDAYVFDGEYGYVVSQDRDVYNSGGAVRCVR